MADRHDRPGVCAVVMLAGIAVLLALPPAVTSDARRPSGPTPNRTVVETPALAHGGPTSGISSRSTEASQHPGLTPGSGGQWYNASTPGGPVSRWGAAVTYDPVEGYLVLFGGLDAQNRPLGDTWTLRGGTWTELCSGTSSAPHCSPAPEPRYEVPATFDVHDGYVVIYGGVGGTNTEPVPLNDTWSFHDGAWSNVTRGVSPGRVFGGPFGALAYDSHDGYVLLFTVYQTTWSFRNGTWTSIPATVHPTTSSDFTLFDDPSDGYDVLFGGFDGVANPVSVTYAYSAGRWAVLNESVHPSARLDALATYDADGGFGVLFGGFSGTTTFRDTWSFTNGTWFNITPSASPDSRLLTTEYLGFDSSDHTLALVASNGPPSIASMYFWRFVEPMHATITASRGTVDVNHDLGLQVDVSGGAGPFAYSFGGLPPGCPTDNVSALDCAPGLPGAYVITVRVNASYQESDAAETFVLVVPALEVAASANWSAVTVGMAVSFFANFTGGTSPVFVTWSFGDGTTSSWPTATHRYTSPGWYVARVTVADSDGSSANASLRIEVSGPLATMVTVAPNVTDAGTPVTFSALLTGGTPPYLVQWIFGDGRIGFGATVVHVYLAPQLYPVVAAVSDAGGAVDFPNITVQVNPAIQVIAKPNTTATFVGVPVRFLALAVGGTGSHYLTWLFGDGGSSALPDPTYTYVAPGLEQVNLTVTDEAGITASVDFTINVTARPLPPSLSPSQPVSGHPPKSGTAWPPWLPILGGAVAGSTVVIALLAVRRRVRSGAQ
ncbi:MAG: PKD domain-containing protein [Thermoplasmata archaeon]|nr:PKD domain-containing protein [Thermoplasmata archaeon]